MKYENVLLGLGIVMVIVVSIYGLWTQQQEIEFYREAPNWLMDLYNEADYLHESAANACIERHYNNNRAAAGCLKRIIDEE